MKHPSKVKYRTKFIEINNLPMHPENKKISLKHLRHPNDKPTSFLISPTLNNKSVTIKKHRYELQENLSKINNTKDHKIVFEDEELSSLWDDLGVKPEFREEFINLFPNIGDKTTKMILDIEKRNLYKIKECIDFLYKELQKRKTLIHIIESITNSYIDNEEDSESLFINNNVIVSFMQEVQKLNQNTCSILILISTIRQLIGFQYENKFIVKKSILNVIFSHKFIVNLSLELNLIRYSKLYEKMNIANQKSKIILPFIFINQDDISKYIEHYFIFIQELTIRNSIKTEKEDVNTSIREYIKHIKYDKQYKSQFTNETYSFTNKGLRKEIQISKPIRNRNQTTNYNHDISNNSELFKHKSDENILNTNQHSSKQKVIITAINKIPSKKDNEDYNSEFKVYIGSLETFNQKYEKYIKTIPDIQITSFKLKNNLIDYFNKYNMLIIIYKYYPNINELMSLLLLTPSNDSPYNFTIIHLSTKAESMELEIQKMISYVTHLFSFWNTIYMSVHYQISNGKAEWNKDLSDLMKKLQFKWVKVENTEKGERFQIFKICNISNKVYLNLHSNSFSNNNNYIKLSSFLLFDSNIFFDNSETISKANIALVDVAKKYYNNKTEELEQETKLINEIQYNEENKKEMSLILRKNNIVTKLNMKEEGKYFFVSFKIKSSFKSTAQIIIGKQEYLLINTYIEEFYDNKTKQLFYMLISEKNYHYLICEINKEFRKDLRNYDNIYESFKELYSRLEHCDTSTKFSASQLKNILIPWFHNNYSENNNMNETQIDYNTILELKTTNTKINNYGNHIKPFSNYDIIINNDFFFAIINDSMLELCNNPCIYCSIINVKS